MPSNDPSLGVRDELRASMKRRSFVELTAVQRAVVDHDARVNNLRISSQTGSGKTVAMGIALADDLIERAAAGAKGPLALLVAPTRELAVQVHRELSWLFEETPLSLVVVTGGANMRRERRALRQRPELVVGTPGRLLDHLRQGTLDLGDARQVVLDEADQMLDMGFRDELDAIVEALPAERRSHLVSATFPSHVRRFADAFQGRAEHLQGTALGEAHEDIDHVAYVVDARQRYEALVNELLMTPDERCLVFVRRRVDAAEVAELLERDGLNAQPLSGELAQAQRTRCLEAFRRGKVRVLVATDVAARGLDIADVGLVVHLDPPSDAANYTHRSGRTGRAGQKGRSLMLVPARGERRARRMLELAKVKARFTAPPTVEEVEAAIRAAAQRRLDAELAALRPDHDLALADRLLAEHEPRELVARLLALSAPVQPTAPRRVRDAARPPRPRAPSKRSHGDESFARFYVTWGRRRGASPKRVLALMCRRGDIAGGDVGRIAVGDHATVVEVAAHVAVDFAERAGARDPRDPHVMIEPYREPRHATAQRTRPPKRRAGKRSRDAAHA
ncbi:MAG TPA: DEAD/DEAH box helicase [Polyangiaceae bacterium]|nr:DEAD/DEAH box helicase [Polyangiaceae bacterium]